MHRPLAVLAAVLALAAPPARAGEPLDLDLTRLGAPTQAVWQHIATSPPSAPQAAQLAADSRVRFARLATDLALAFSSAVLQPASTTGASGWDFDLETSMVTVKAEVVGGTAWTPAGGAAPYSADTWPTRSVNPSQLLLPSFHVRKAFPYSVELGGRVTYLSQSLYFATQLEAKWAMIEGYSRLPDVAVRIAWTRLAGQRDLRLSTTELDLMVSHRFGMSAAVSLTPYLALRYSLLSAGTGTMLFDAYSGIQPQDPAQVSAAFPTLTSQLLRTTVGARMMASALSLAAELTYFGGASGGSASGGSDESRYPRYKVPSSLGGAFKLGFEF
jgi:hypothetical protein